MANCGIVKRPRPAAAQETQQCLVLLEELARLHPQSHANQSQPKPLQEFTGAIEDAAGLARIDSASLDRIWPQPPRRIENTDYQVRATEISLRRVTLQALFTFLHALAKSPGGPSIASMRLVESGVDTAQEKWDVLVRLEQTVLRSDHGQG